MQLQMQSLQDKANSTTEYSALRAQCMIAEAEVDKLQGENEILKQMSAEPEDATATSAALRPLSFPTLSGMESGLVTQGRIEWTRNAASVTPPFGEARRHSALCWACHQTRWFYPVSFPQGWIGKEPCAFITPVFWDAQRDCRASPREWLSYGN